MTDEQEALLEAIRAARPVQTATEWQQRSDAKLAAMRNEMAAAVATGNEKTMLATEDIQRREYKKWCEDGRQ